MEDKRIAEFSVYDLSAKKTIFSDTSISYVIPLYQRAFAWEDKEIVQLIDDINDFDNKDGNSYYLGAIIVSRKDNRYEVIDGQQRLTALFLLLNYLDLPMESILSFECRKKSDYTLQMIVNDKVLSIDDTDDSLLNGKKIIENEFGKYTDSEKEAFINKLSSVKIYRIEVPEYTDLNHYFEIMNTRGEQLEQQDILKADLMSSLDEKYMATFSKIWDACSDMTGYVQMHFDTDIRAEIFGSNWEYAPNCKFEVHDDRKSGKSIKDIIIDPKFVFDNKSIVSDSDGRVRFESIITFPYFLLHVLKIYVWANGIEAHINELLDDKKLSDTFSSVIEKGTKDGCLLDKAAFSKGFVRCLLKCRFLFDKFIVKREFVNDDSDGDWSIKSLHSSGQQSKKKPYYSNSYFGVKNEWEQTYKARHRRVLMLQSLLRVSYTSPKVMHWITELMRWLYIDSNRDDMSRFEAVIEEYICFGAASNANGSVTVKDYLNAGNYDMGVNTPHLIFNYLDYLLWKRDLSKYSNFVFEFRNSVEHWYPRHPSEGTFEQWAPDAGVNSFGNLCIIQRNVNSKFSNMSPESKQSTFEDMISNGSIKLRIMAEIVRKMLHEGVSPNKEWKESAYKEHENEMLKILRSACGL